jgi:ATP-dependent DNA helicase DinG
MHRSSLQQAIAQILGPDGGLGRALAGGYEERQGQRQMMEAVSRAIDAQTTLLVEAGTGTGKSLAYLVPAVLAGKQTIVSTATKTLQRQLFEKDLPLVASVTGVAFRAALLKGRTNYLCLQRLEEEIARPRLDAETHLALLTIARWSRSTETGDREEIEVAPGAAEVWPRVSTGAEGCLGSSCPRLEACFVMQARREAAAAHLVVVNHHLYFADLALRTSSSFALLPEAELSIFDEAHHVEDVAGQFFGLQVSDQRIGVLLGDLARGIEARGESAEMVRSLGSAVKGASDALFQAYAALVPRTRLTPETRPGDWEERWHRLDDGLDMAQAAARGRADLDPGLMRIAERAQELRRDLATLVTLDDPRLVAWVERGARAPFLRAVPIDGGGVLRKVLFARLGAAVFTSATLATSGTFEHTRRRLGLDHPGEELVVGSPFDHRTQARLYLPLDLPSPNQPGFIEAAAPRIAELVALTEGRTLCLFTSIANLRSARELCGALDTLVGGPILVQGEGPPAELLARFRAGQARALFATASFWEGVDVVGAALSQVIIDRLPFAPPDDPITAARMEAMRAEGQDPFLGYQVPSATLMLKQGVGRLLRHREDRGIVTILDKRVRVARYGASFLRSLPDIPHTHDLEALRAWWTGAEDAGEAGVPRLTPPGS